MSNVLSTSSSRQEACSLVLCGLESLRKGLILYHELGITTKEIYADLKAAGWDKSMRTLERHQTDLRKEGLLPAGKRGQAVTPLNTAKSGGSPVENSTPISVAPATTVFNPPTYELQSTLVATELLDEDEFRVGRCDSDQAERDYDRALECIDTILRLTKQYYKSGWSSGKWAELDGEARLISECCRPRASFFKRQESERNDPSGAIDTTATCGESWID